MKDSAERAEKTELLDKLFSYLAHRGLENITIREMCKGTGVVQGTLYYWFGDKTTIICECAEYGIQKVTDEIFKYVFANMQDLKRFFSVCLDAIDAYKTELRFMYQMAASPVYGAGIRAKAGHYTVTYDKYAAELANKLQCDAQTLRPLVRLFVSAVLDYVIWEERDATQMQLDFIYSSLTAELHRVNGHTWQES